MSEDSSTWGPRPDDDQFDASTISEFTNTRRDLEDDDLASRYSKYSLRSSIIHGSFDRTKNENILEVDLESACRPPESDYASHVPEDVLRELDGDGPTGFFKTSGLFNFGAEMYASIRNIKKKQRRRIGLGCILLVLICAIIGVSVAGFGGDDSQDTRLPFQPGRFQNLTVHQKRLDAVARSSSDELAFIDEKSPQSLARQWLIFNDTLWDDEEGEVAAERIQQRYSLAVFYFGSGGGEAWKSNWLSGDECDGWEYINCNQEGQVRAIVFDDVGLSGTLSRELAHLKQLEDIIIKNEPSLTGSISNSFGRLIKLRQLGLYNNALTGGIPRELYYAKSLVYLNLERNQLSGPILPDIESLTNLETLNLGHNQFSGLIPWSSLEKLRLRYLNLSHNKLSGSISPQIGEFSQLDFVYLNDNQLGGRIPISLGNAKTIRSLNLSNCGLVGQIPIELGGMDGLEHLDLSKNGLQGAIPGQLTSLQRLLTLDLSTNVLIGSLPDFSKLDSLIKLHVYENRLVGSLPSKLLDMKSLTSLSVASNGFTGRIPSVGKKNDALKVLLLSANNLIGPIDDKICYLENIENLMLDDNDFSGEIPKCLDKLKKMKHLHLSGNFLQGGVPNNLDKLNELESLGLNDNLLVGDVGKVCELGLKDFWSDCGGDKPEVSCPCCTACCHGDKCRPR